MAVRRPLDALLWLVRAPARSRIFRYWLKRYGLRTKNSRGPRAGEARSAKAAGLLITTMSCSRHGAAQFFLEGSGYYRCVKCRSDAVSRRRRKVKEILVREAGDAV